MQAEIFNEEIQNFVLEELKDAFDFLEKNRPDARDLERITADVMKRKTEQIEALRQALADEIVSQIDGWVFANECAETDKYMMGEL